MISSMLRYYLYFRRGLGHLGVILSGFTFINTFYLVSRDWLFFKDIGYTTLALVGFFALIPLMVFMGYLDYKRGFFKVESSVSTEENPYLRDLFTEKERTYLMPLTMGAAKLALEMNKELSEKFNINSPEFRKAYADLLKAYDNVAGRLNNA